MEEALSMNPSDKICDKRTSIENLPLINPVPAFKVFFNVLNEPKELSKMPYELEEISSVFMFKLAPKAAAPFVDVPIPR